jgi:hypothetical protein
MIENTINKEQIVKILQISRDGVKIELGGGGIEEYIYNLSLRLSNIGHKVTVLERHHSKTSIQVEFIDKVSIINLNTIIISYRIISKMPSTIELLFREFNQALSKAAFFEPPLTTVFNPPGDD